MDDLIEGYRRFRQGRFQEQQRLYRELETGQSPGTMIVSCCDSRVDPATIFDARPGEMFIVRNVASLVPAFETQGEIHGTSAALEFAVTGLKVSRIVVMAHASCGGVAACLAHDFWAGTQDSFILRWISMLRPAKDKLLRELHAAGKTIDGGHSEEAQLLLEQESVRVSIENLTTFPFVRRAMEDRGLILDGAHFGIGKGLLTVLHRETGEFVEVPDKPARM